MHGDTNLFILTLAILQCLFSPKGRRGRTYNKELTYAHSHLKHLYKLNALDVYEGNNKELLPSIS